MPSRRDFVGSLLRLAPASLCLPVRARAATLTGHPYLQNVGPGPATIFWTTWEDSQGAVRFSTDRNLTGTSASTVRELTPEETELPASSFRHRVRLEDLGEGAVCQYQVYADGEPLTFGEDTRFRTACPGAFRFLAFGDSGTGGGAQRQLAARMLQEEVCLAVHTGDVAYPSASFQQFQAHHFDVYRDLFQRVPMFPSLGNHEYWTGNGAPYLALHEVPAAGVPAKDHGRYYSFDWGNVHFVALDSNLPLSDAVRGRGAMLQWLDEDLRVTAKYWKIVYFHHPPYAWGPNEGDSHSALARDYIVPILEQRGVQLVLNGHEHSYQRSHPIRGGEIVPHEEGIVYLTTGGGGGGLYPVHAHRLLAAGASLHHYLRITVEESRLTAVAVSLDGSEIDRCVVGTPPAPSSDGAVRETRPEP